MLTVHTVMFQHYAKGMKHCGCNLSVSGNQQLCQLVNHFIQLLRTEMEDDNAQVVRNILGELIIADFQTLSQFYCNFIPLFFRHFYDNGNKAFSCKAVFKIAQQMGDEIVVAKLNIDEVPLVAHREAIEVIPTLVLYRNGKALGSIVAPESKARIEQFIDESLA